MGGKLERVDPDVSGADFCIFQRAK
ncbi:hypothetical protein ACU36R_11450 [Pectobacterium brasiliense]